MSRPPLDDIDVRTGDRLVSAGRLISTADCGQPRS